jgi:Acetyltransferase (GNAT) domain
MIEPSKLRDFAELSYKEVHDIIFPADVRETDLVRASIYLRGSSKPESAARVWKLSPLGIEFLLEEGETFSKGTSLDVSLQVGRQLSRFEGIVVDCSEQLRGKLLLVVRLYGRRSENLRTGDRRDSTRWICSSQFHPVAVAPNPLVFNDFIYFSIRDISSKGVRALTSLRNKYVVPGMSLELQVSFPMTGHALLRAKVVRTALTSDAGKDYLELGMELSELGKGDRETIGQYLVQFSSAETYSEIKKAGFTPVSLAKGIDYSFIRSSIDFEEVLKLRLLANKAVGKIPDEYSATSMADAFDSRCRILAAKFKGKVVGTIRLGFVDQDETMEIEKYVKLPPSFPRRDQIVECSRAATHPDFRRADLWYSLVQHAAISALQAKRQFGVICTTRELIIMYRRLGFQETGIVFKMPLYPDVEQHLLIVDIPGVISGVNVGPFAWAVVWQKVSEYLRNQPLFSSDLLSNTRLRIYSIISPFARLASKLAIALQRRS